MCAAQMMNAGREKGVKDVEWNLQGLSGPFSLREFVPKDAPEELWQAYFTLSEMSLREFHKRDRLPDRGAVRKMLLATSPLYHVRRWIVLDEGRSAIASASMIYDSEISPDYESSKHLCQVRILVVPAYRRKKIATHFVKHTIETARLLERDAIMAEADNPLGLAFCKRLRGELVHEEVEHRLYVEDIDWQLVEKWLQRGKTKARDTKIQFFQECPEDDIGEFCRIYTEIIDQRPTGDMEQGLITTPESRRLEERNLKKRGIDWYTMISREHDGQISGVTDIMYKPEEPHRMNQYFTGVLAKYRRRGLAKRLKAEMLVAIKNRFPDVEYITTTTARTNYPMRSINKELGFRPTKTCFTFRWDLRELRALTPQRKDRKRVIKRVSPGDVELEVL